MTNNLHLDFSNSRYLFFETEVFSNIRTRCLIVYSGCNKHLSFSTYVAYCAVCTYVLQYATALVEKHCIVLYYFT